MASSELKFVLCSIYNLFLFFSFQIGAIIQSHNRFDLVYSRLVLYILYFTEIVTATIRDLIKPTSFSMRVANFEVVAGKIR